MDTSTSYLGLSLPHPFIAGASPFGHHLDSVKGLEDAGCATIVLHSLFEEQITLAREGRVAHMDAWEPELGGSLKQESYGSHMCVGSHQSDRGPAPVAESCCVSEGSRSTTIVHVNEPCAPAEAHKLPGVLLRKLPPLAPELQYRLVHFDLVLWDVHAYLVVDFLPDAFRLGDAVPAYATS